jgi:hypothetical protein
LPHSVRYALHIARQTEPRRYGSYKAGFGGVRTQGSLRTAFLDIIGLLLNRTLVEKVTLGPGQKDDAVLFLRAIRQSKGTDRDAVAGPDADRERTRIDAFRGRFVESIKKDRDDGPRRGVYLRTLGRLYAAALRDYTPTRFKTKGPEAIAVEYADALLSSLESVAGALPKAKTAPDPCPHGENKRTCAQCKSIAICTHGRRQTMCKECQQPKTVTPSDSTIREIPDSETESELFNTEWWPKEMYLLWIYDPRPRDENLDLFDLAILGSEKKGIISSRSRFIKRLGTFPVIEDTMSKDEYKEARLTAMARLRSMIKVQEPTRIPKMIVFDLRHDDESTADDVSALRDATAKLGVWVSHLGTTKRPICVVVLSDETGDAEHAAIALDDGSPSVPDAREFLSKLALPGDADDANPKEEASLANALDLAALPTTDGKYEPVRRTAGTAAPRYFSLVSASEPPCSRSVRYEAKNMRVFLAGDDPSSIVPHVRVTNETAGLFVRYLTNGRADHASQLRVIDATLLTMPTGDGNSPETETTKSHDLNVAVLLAVAMDTPSVLIVTKAQSRRMRKELGWMDRVFAKGAEASDKVQGKVGGNVGGEVGSKVGGKGNGALGSPSASGAAGASRASGGQGSKSKGSPVSGGGGPHGSQPKTSPAHSTVLDPDAADVGSVDGAAAASQGGKGGGGAGAANGIGTFTIFEESLRIVKHADGGNKCPQNMIRAADGYRARYKDAGSEERLEFLVSLGAYQGGGFPHHSDRDGEPENAIYIRCAPVRAGAAATTDGALEIDYPEALSMPRRIVTDDQDELKTKVHEAIDARTKIYIVCTEQSAADGVGAEVPLPELLEPNWGYYYAY